MKSSYKKLGPYIQEVKVKNKDLKVDKLLGVSITKKFIPSIANTVGTDMSKYKIVMQNQFAYGPVTSRNGEKISVALLEDDCCIISTSYSVFKIIDHNELIPEYLMMWFSRPEFDRYARYMSHGSVRELFGWDEMCGVELPIPNINKQKEIVEEYRTVVDRIKLNEKLNQKLEETAQAIYKQWFVDFEFPTSKEYAVEIGKPELEGKPYKSSGGKMVWNDELGQEIPDGWDDSAFTAIINLSGGGTPSTGENVYWDGEIPFFTPKDVGSSIYSIATEKTITDEGLKGSSTKLYDKNTVFITARGTVGAVAMAPKQMAMNQSCYAATGKNGFGQYFVYQHTIEALKKLRNEAIGGVFGALVTRDFDAHVVLKPNIALSSKFDDIVAPIFEYVLIRQLENVLLQNSLYLFLSKISHEETNT